MLTFLTWLDKYVISFVGNILCLNNLNYQNIVRCILLAPNTKSRKKKTEFNDRDVHLFKSVMSNVNYQPGQKYWIEYYVGPHKNLLKKHFIHIFVF